MLIIDLNLAYITKDNNLFLKEERNAMPAKTPFFVTVKQSVNPQLLYQLIVIRRPSSKRTLGS